MFTDWVCRCQPLCLCAGADQFDCDCDRNPGTNLCGDCGQPMEEIAATGEAPKAGG